MIRIIWIGRRSFTVSRQVSLKSSNTGNRPIMSQSYSPDQYSLKLREQIDATPEGINPAKRLRQP